MTLEVVRIAPPIDTQSLVVAPDNEPAPIIRVDISGWTANEIGAYLTSAELNGYKGEVWDINDRLCLTISGKGDSMGFYKTVTNILVDSH